MPVHMLGNPADLDSICGIAKIERSVNVSIGVVDPGIGSAFGINIDSSDPGIEAKAAELKKAIAEA